MNLNLQFKVTLRKNWVIHDEIFYQEDEQDLEETQKILQRTLK
jgi:hypothetical protein